MVFTKQKNLGLIYRTKTNTKIENKKTQKKTHQPKQTRHDKKDNYMEIYKNNFKKEVLFGKNKISKARSYTNYPPMFLVLGNDIFENNDFDSHIDLLIYDKISLTHWRSLRYIIYNRDSQRYIVNVNSLSYYIHKNYKLIRLYVGPHHLLNVDEYALRELSESRKLTCYEIDYGYLYFAYIKKDNIIFPIQV